MRSFFLLTTSICLYINLCSNPVFAQRCKMKPIVQNCMGELAPYNYDSYAVKGILYGSKTKTESVDFVLFEGDSCKLVFCKSELPQALGITIYNSPPKEKYRKIIYIDDSGKKDQYVFSFKAEKTGSYYIEFEVPPATAPNQQGCIVVLIGTKGQDLGDE